MGRGWKSLLSILVLILVAVGGMPAYQATASVGHATEVPEGYIGIFSLDDLNDIRSDLRGKYILMRDLDMTAATAEGGKFFRDGAGWEPIGTDPEPFRGIFDGNGYSIIGMKVYSQAKVFTYAGLFGYTFNAELRNIDLVDVAVLANNTSLVTTGSFAYAGGLVGYAHNVKMENVTVSGQVEARSLFNGLAGGVAGVVYTDSSYKESKLTNISNKATVKAKNDAGGIVGDTLKTRIIQSTNKGSIEGERRVGGVVGSVRSDTVIENAINYGTITVTGSGTGGGIGGNVNYSNISESVNEGVVTSSSSSVRTGGIAGTLNQGTVIESHNKGKVRNTGQYSGGGGIAGSSHNQSSVIRVFNFAEVSSSSYAGGIIGTSYSTFITESYNNGMVKDAGYSGGITGYTSETTVKDSFNNESVSAMYDAGGISGKGTSSTIINSYNIGMITATSSIKDIGGLAGDFDGTIIDSFYIDTVSKGVGNGVDVEESRKTFHELQAPATYKNFNFTDVWKMGTHVSYKFPELLQAPYQGKEMLNNIKLVSQPKKTTYLKGEELDLTGATLQAYTNHGNEWNVPLTAEMTRGFNPATPGNQTVTISYEGLTTSFPVQVIATYTVTFKDWNGDILKTETVPSGSAATAPPTPEREGYDFTGWDKSFSYITFNLTITAKYEIKRFTIKYMENDKVIKEETYPYNTNVYQPHGLEKPGFALVAWYKDKGLKTRFSFEDFYIQSDLTLYAKYMKTPSTPTNVKVTAVDYDQITVTFDKVSGAHGYEVFIGETRDQFSYSHWDDPSANKKEFYGLTPGKTYYFFVRSFIDDGTDRSYGIDTPLYTGKTALKTISSLKAEATAFDKIKLSWNQVDSAHGYQVYRSTSVNGTYSKVATISSNTTLQYTNSGLHTGNTYYYKVRTYRVVDGKTIYGSYSSVKSGKTFLAKVGGIVVASVDYNKLKISWNQVSGANGFEIYRATSKTGSYSKIATITSGSTKTYTNSSLTTGKTYYYKVRAYRTINSKKVYGSFSDIKSGKPVLGVPGSFKVAKKNNTTATLTWTKVSGASGYQIYRSTSKSGTYTKVKTITSGSTVKFENGSLSRSKTYYYKIRAYRVVNGKNIYSSYSTVVSRSW